MGRMMTDGVAWAILLSLVGLAVAVTCGIVSARVLRGRLDGHALNQESKSRETDDARAALRMRYARGEISREDYLQGKVELED